MIIDPGDMNTQVYTTFNPPDPLAHVEGMTQEELRERAEPNVKQAFEEQRQVLQGCADRRDTQGLWLEWPRTLERPLLKAFHQDEESCGNYARRQSRGTVCIRLRNVGPPTPRWEEGNGSMEELLQSDWGAHARKVERTFTAIRDRLRKAPWSDETAMELCGAMDQMQRVWAKETFPGVLLLVEHYLRRGRPATLAEYRGEPEIDETLGSVIAQLYTVAEAEDRKAKEARRRALKAR